MITRRQMILGLLSAGGTSLVPGLLRAGSNTLLGAMSGWVFEPDRLRALLAASERILPGVVEAGFEDYINYWLVREPFNRAADWKPLLNIGAVHLDRIAIQRFFPTPGDGMRREFFVRSKVRWQPRASRLALHRTPYLLVGTPQKAAGRAGRNGLLRRKWAGPRKRT